MDASFRFVVVVNALVLRSEDWWKDYRSRNQRRYDYLSMDHYVTYRCWRNRFADRQWIGKRVHSTISFFFFFSPGNKELPTRIHRHEWMAWGNGYEWSHPSIFQQKRFVELESFAWSENFVQLYSDYIRKLLFWPLIFWPGFTSDRYIFHEHWQISFGRCRSRLEWIYKKHLCRSPVGISFGDEIVFLDIFRRLVVLRLQFRTVGDTMAKTVTVRATRFV